MARSAAYKKCLGHAKLKKTKVAKRHAINMCNFKDLVGCMKQDGHFVVSSRCANISSAARRTYG